MALAIFACWLVRDARVRLLGGLVLLSVIISLGDQGFLYALLRKCFPILGFIRYPIKFVVLAIVTIPLLAAFAIQKPAERRPIAPNVIAITIASSQFSNRGAASKRYRWAARNRDTREYVRSKKTKP